MYLKGLFLQNGGKSADRKESSAAFQPNPTTTKVKPKKVANTTTPLSAKSGNGAGLTKERTNSPVTMKPEVSPPGQPAEMSVPALKKPEPAPANVEVAAPS